MTPYDASFKGIYILFDKDNNNTGRISFFFKQNSITLPKLKICTRNILFQWWSRSSIRQGRTYFNQFSKLATYDLRKTRNEAAPSKMHWLPNPNKFDFIVVNYANCDMVGHTECNEAIEKP